MKKPSNRKMAPPSGQRRPITRICNDGGECLEVWDPRYGIYVCKLCQAEREP
jgi:hypothetical protein